MHQYKKIKTDQNLFDILPFFFTGKWLVLIRVITVKQ